MLLVERYNVDLPGIRGLQVRACDNTCGILFASSLVQKICNRHVRYLLTTALHRRYVQRRLAWFQGFRQKWAGTT
jgi:hypothetical protein